MEHKNYELTEHFLDALNILLNFGNTNFIIRSGRISENYNLLIEKLLAFSRLLLSMKLKNFILHY